jgi:predicted O-methyltransferase YrrM
MILACFDLTFGKQLGQASRIRTVHDYFRLLACVELDRFHLAGNGQRLARLVKVRGLEHVESALAEGKGVVIARARAIENHPRASIKRRIFFLLFRRRLPLGFGLQELGPGKIFTDASELLSQFLPGGIDAGRMEDLRIEFSESRAEIGRRYDNTETVFPIEWKMDDGSLFLIHCIVRLTKPETILETGVANGHSSFYILRALSLNGKGTLWSTDISTDAGSLISQSDRANWHLKVLDSRNAMHSFRNLVNEIGKIDLFIHDSGDHNYRLQSTEYEQVLPRMPPGSILASDDVDASYAFVDFSRKNNAYPYFLLDVNQNKDAMKIFGLFAKP